MKIYVLLSAYLFISFMCTSLLFAQDTLLTALPELPELYYDYAEIQNWQMPADKSLSYIDAPISKIEARCNAIPHTNQLTNRLLFAYSKPEDNNQILSGVLYQKLKRKENPINRGQISLYSHYPTQQLSFLLGHYRLNAGEGLVLGAYQSSNIKKHNLLFPAQGLSHPALTGFAVKSEITDTDVLLWISQTKRNAKLVDNKISSLYESSLYDNHVKDKVTESTSGVIVQHTIFKNILGAYYYHHTLSHTLADSLVHNPPSLYGLYAGFLFKPYTLGFESSFSDKQNANAIRFEHKLKDITQAFHYIRRPYNTVTSYAKTEQVFGQQTGREELSWDISFRKFDNITLIGRFALQNDLTGENDSHWTERIIVSANHHVSDRHIGLTYYRFRKDAIPCHDSLSAEMLPIQNRIKGLWKQSIAYGMEYSLACQYQCYRKEKLTNNGIKLSQTINYSFNNFKLTAAFYIWSNQQSQQYSSELLDSDDYVTQTDSDSAFKISAVYLCSKKIRIHLQAYRPNHYIENQSYNLSLTTAF